MNKGICEECHWFTKFLCISGCDAYYKIIKESSYDKKNIHLKLLSGIIDYGVKR
jgi:hypothetical protein